MQESQHTHLPSLCILQVKSHTELGENICIFFENNSTTENKNTKNNKKIILGKNLIEEKTTSTEKKHVLGKIPKHNLLPKLPKDSILIGIRVETTGEKDPSTQLPIGFLVCRTKESASGIDVKPHWIPQIPIILTPSGDKTLDEKLFQHTMQSMCGNKDVNSFIQTEKEFLDLFKEKEQDGKPNEAIVYVSTKNTQKPIILKTTGYFFHRNKENTLKTTPPIETPGLWILSKTIVLIENGEEKITGSWEKLPKNESTAKELNLNSVQELEDMLKRL